MQNGIGSKNFHFTSIIFAYSGYSFSSIRTLEFE